MIAEALAWVRKGPTLYPKPVERAFQTFRMVHRDGYATAGWTVWLACRPDAEPVLVMRRDYFANNAEVA